MRHREHTRSKKITVNRISNEKKKQHPIQNLQQQQFEYNEHKFRHITIHYYCSNAANWNQIKSDDVCYKIASTQKPHRYMLK